MSDTDMERDQFIELLPFYINGTLAESLRIQVDDYLTRHPAAKAELMFSAALSSAVSAPLNERDPMAGYVVLEKRLQLKAASPPAPPFRQTKKNAGTRWWRGVSHYFAGLGLSPAMSVVILMLSTLIAGPSLFSNEPSAPVNALTGTESHNLRGYRGGSRSVRQGDLKIVISPKASFEDIVRLMSQNQCRIVWGPSTSGELWLSVEIPGAAAAIQTQLAASPLVQDVQLLTAEAAQ